MTLSTPSDTSITALQLAERLAAGERLTVLDVRDDATWAIEAPDTKARHLPAAAVLADPAADACRTCSPPAGRRWSSTLRRTPGTTSHSRRSSARGSPTSSTPTCTP